MTPNVSIRVTLAGARGFDFSLEEAREVHSQLDKIFGGGGSLGSLGPTTVREVVDAWRTLAIGEKIQRGDEVRYKGTATFPPSSWEKACGLIGETLGHSCAHSYEGRRLVNPK